MRSRRTTVRSAVMVLTLAGTLACGGSGASTDAGVEVPRESSGVDTARAKRQSPCSLLKRAELEEILRSPLEDGTADGSECVFGSAGSPWRSVKMNVYWTGGREELDAARTGVGMVNRALRGPVGEQAAPGADLEGLGDDAFFAMAGFVPMLFVRQGDAAISLECSGATREQTVAIARKALERLK
jgi:hypothetical protein